MVCRQKIVSIVSHTYSVAILRKISTAFAHTILRVSASTDGVRNIDACSSPCHTTGHPSAVCVIRRRTGICSSKCSRSISKVTKVRWNAKKYHHSKVRMCHVLTGKIKVAAKAELQCCHISIFSNIPLLIGERWFNAYRYNSVLVS